jgi:hypothetical protein
MKNTRKNIIKSYSDFLPFNTLFLPKFGFKNANVMRFQIKNISLPGNSVDKINSF